MTSKLLHRLGLPETTRALVVSCSGLGVSHATTQGVLGALRLGVATTASLMVPCPWARDAAGRATNRDDLGVAITLNAENDQLRWGPITTAPTLHDGDGGFPRTAEDLWDHADVEEVRREGRAQLERAVQWGIDVTHLSSHLDALLLRPEFYDVYLDLAVEFGLPIRLPEPAAEARVQFPLRDLAEEASVLHVDRVVSLRSTGSRTALLEVLRSLEPGVTEVRLRPAIDSAELRAYAPDWANRVDDYNLATGDAELAAVLSGVRRLGYRELRAAQRSSPTPR